MSDLHDRARNWFDSPRANDAEPTEIIAALLAENERLTNALAERQAHWRDAVAEVERLRAGAVPVAWMTADPVWRQCFTTEEQARVYYKEVIPLYTAPPAPAVPESVSAADYKQQPGSKNCMQLAVAYMLGLPLDAVPDFERLHGPDPTAWELMERFVKTHGCTAEMLPPNIEILGDYLAEGVTERGTAHMVVMRRGKLLHDPHPSGVGLKEIQNLWLIVRRAGLFAPAPPAPAVPRPIQRWPFAESPGEFAQRLRDAMVFFGDALPAIRNVVIENPPTLSRDYLWHLTVAAPEVKP